MLNAQLVDAFTQRIAATLDKTPMAEIDKNLRATLTGLFAKLDLVTREEFDVQSAVLARAQAQLAELEARLAALETGGDNAASPATVAVTH